MKKLVATEEASAEIHSRGLLARTQLPLLRTVAVASKSNPREVTWRRDTSYFVTGGGGRRRAKGATEVD